MGGPSGYGDQSLQKQTSNSYGDALTGYGKLAQAGGNMMGDMSKQLGYSQNMYNNLSNMGQSNLNQGNANMGQAGSMFAGQDAYGQNQAIRSDTIGNKAGNTYGQMASVDPQAIAAAQLKGQNLQPYMNPYTNSVINATMGEMGRQEQLQRKNIAAEAQAQGAFGGDRQAIENAENNRNFDQQRSQTLSALNQQNFGQAQSAAQIDNAAKMQADLANQQMQVGQQAGGASGLAGLSGQAGQLGQGYTQGAAQGLAGIGNQQSGVGAQLGTAGAGGFSNNAQFLGNLGQGNATQGLGGLQAGAGQGFGFGNQLQQNQLQAGQMQQDQQQQLIDMAKQAFGQTVGGPKTGLDVLMQSLTGSHNPQTSMSKSKTSNGIGGILGGVGSMIGGK